MLDKEKVSEQALKWLSLRLERANFVEKKLNSLIRKDVLDEGERKLYSELLIDSKNIGVKEILSIYETMGENDSSSGFEDFE